MARKKLSVKAENKKVSLSKKLKLKSKEKVNVVDLFDLDKPIFTSFNIVTDDNWIALIVPDADKFVMDNKLENKVVSFVINEDDLAIEYYKNDQLEPYQIDPDIFIFETIGSINDKQYYWFKQTYPNCAFYKITKWFGKEVNTLVIVLVEELGKPVGILKTIE